MSCSSVKNLIHEGHLAKTILHGKQKKKSRGVSKFVCRFFLHLGDETASPVPQRLITMKHFVSTCSLHRFLCFYIILYIVYYVFSKCRGFSHSHSEGIHFHQSSRESQISNKALKMFVTHNMSKSNHRQTKNVVLGKLQFVPYLWLHRITQVNLCLYLCPLIKISHYVYTNILKSPESKTLRFQLFKKMDAKSLFLFGNAQEFHTHHYFNLHSNFETRP